MSWTTSKAQMRPQPASPPPTPLPSSPGWRHTHIRVQEALQDLLAAPPGTYALFPRLTHPFCSALRPKTHSCVLYTWETQDQTC